jgi:type IV pilus assembly protein PilB
VNPKKRLGEMLMDAGIIDETQLKSALGHQRQWGVRIGQALVDLKLATEADIVRALSAKFGFPVAQLGELEPYGLEQAVNLLPREFAVRNNVFPMAADSGTLTVAMSDPTNLAVVDEIRFRTGRRVKVCMGGDREVAEAVKRHYPEEGAQVEAIALDLDADDGQSEAVFDPFGGGSKDALDAFFGHGPEAGAMPELGAPAPTEPAAPARPRAPAPPPPPPPSPSAGPRASPPGSAPRAAAVTAAPAKPQAPAAAAPRAPARAAAVTPAPSPASQAAPAPTAARQAAAPAPRPAAPAPPQAAVPSPAAGAARASPSAAAPASVPPAQHRAPVASAPAVPRRAVELELEKSPAPAAGSPDVPAGSAEPPFALAPADLAPFPEEMSGGEPILATDLAPGGEMVEGRTPKPRPLTPEEVAILDALDRLAEGHHAEPNIVKPTQAMAALVRLLLRKRVITEQEFLDEFGKK